MDNKLPLEYRVDELERIIKILLTKHGHEIVKCKHDCHKTYNSGLWQDGSPCMYCNGLGWNTAEGVIK